MSAPQLPRVSLDADWFLSTYGYPISTIAGCTSTTSSPPSQYSQTAGQSPESAKSSVSSKPTSNDDDGVQPALPAVEYCSLVSSDDSAARSSMASVPVATPDNHFLGFCKGAWNLQNGDQKGSMKKCSEADAWSRNAARKRGHAQYLKVSESLTV